MQYIFKIRMNNFPQAGTSFLRLATAIQKMLPFGLQNQVLIIINLKSIGDNESVWG